MYYWEGCQLRQLSFLGEVDLGLAELTELAELDRAKFLVMHSVAKSPAMRRLMPISTEIAPETVETAVFEYEGLFQVGIAA